jgi:23S rRNA pseudouridine955/2504/2580 synthase
MPEITKESVHWLTIDETGEGQRLDNFLIARLKGVPKSHLYRLVRSGEVRVNSRRVDSGYRLRHGDRVRIPPLRTARRETAGEAPLAGAPALEKFILYEDDALIALAKPAGMAVHGGSGISRGVVEQMRLERPQAKFLELAHRLDKETSGILLLAKKRAALLALHALLREGGADKRYLVLVKGAWRDEKRHVKLPLHKFVAESGERRVVVQEGGQAAHTVFRLLRQWADFSLLEAELLTGRTHQIRVHLAHLGYPIAGDDKYGDFALNKALQKRGLRRMFLHAWRLRLPHPVSGETLALHAPLPQELRAFLDGLGAPVRSLEEFCAL